MSDETRTIAWYESRISKFAVDSKSAQVGFDDPGRQELRWRVLLEGAHISENTRILDAGCGLAGMLDYIKRTFNVMPFYTGTDIVEPYLTQCRARFTEQQETKATFNRINVMKDDIVGSFDIITASGLFTLKLENQWNSIEYFLKSAFAALNDGGCIAVNLFTTHVNYRDPEFGYYEPERIYTLARSISKYLVLRSDYLPFDFTLYLYKKNEDTQGSDI